MRKKKRKQQALSKNYVHELGKSVSCTKEGRYRLCGGPLVERATLLIVAQQSRTRTVGEVLDEAVRNTYTYNPNINDTDDEEATGFAFDR